MRRFMQQGILSRIGQNQKGIATIEAAVALPILVTLILGTYDLSAHVARSYDLEQIAQSVTSLAQAKKPTGNDVAYLVTAAQTAAGSKASSVAVTLYQECNGVRQATYDAACASNLQRAIYVSVVLKGTYTPAFAWPGLPSSYAVQGDSVVRIQ